MVDGPKGITKMYLERMLAAHNMKPNDVDFVFAGATAARFQALQSGAIDATILLPPFSFAGRGRGLQQSRADRRLREGPAVHRRRP